MPHIDDTSTLTSLAIPHAHRSVLTPRIQFVRPSRQRDPRHDLIVALERGEQRDAIAHAVCVGEAALLAVGAVARDEVPAGPVGRLVPRAAVCTSGAPPPFIQPAAAAAPSSSRVGVAPDVPAGASAVVWALGSGIGELAVEVGAGEAIASAGAPVDADLPGSRRRGGAGGRAQAVVHALVAEATVGLYVHVAAPRVCSAREEAQGWGEDAVR